MALLVRELNNLLLENQQTAILVLDAKLAAHYANPAAEQLMGASWRKLQERSLFGVVVQSSLPLTQLQAALEMGQGISDSDVTWLLDGHSHQIALSATPIFWQQAKALLVEMRSISHQQQLHHEWQQQAQQQAAKELIRGLAHEIKNPLGGLKGAAQLLEKMLASPELKEYTALIIAQADRLKNLVDKMLGPQQVSSKKPENIHLVLEKVHQLIAVENPALRLIRDYDPSLPDLNIDAEQIEQALLNVARNAAQILGADPNGKITFRTRTEHQALINGKRHRLAARIDIVDNGPGVAPHLLDTLFYPMVSGRAQGTGLGLAIARDLITQHQGKISVSSWPGETCFTILLPLASKEFA